MWCSITFELFNVYIHFLYGLPLCVTLTTDHVNSVVQRMYLFFLQRVMLIRAFFCGYERHQEQKVNENTDVSVVCSCLKAHHWWKILSVCLQWWMVIALVSLYTLRALLLSLDGYRERRRERCSRSLMSFSGAVHTLSYLLFPSRHG